MIAVENGLRYILYLRIILFHSFTTCEMHVCACMQYVHVHMSVGECQCVCEGQSLTSGPILRNHVSCLGNSNWQKALGTCWIGAGIELRFLSIHGKHFANLLTFPAFLIHVQI